MYVQNKQSRRQASAKLLRRLRLLLWLTVPLTVGARWRTFQPSVANESMPSYVVSLSTVDIKMRSKWDKFRKSVSSLCGGSFKNWKLTPGYVRSRRGEGITMAFRNIIRQERHMTPFIFMYEDDARPLNDLVCDQTYIQYLLQNLPEDTFVLLLAAHHTVKTGLPVNRLHFTFQPVNYSFGAYAWVVPTRHANFLSDYWGKQLLSTTESFSPDIDIAKLRGENGRSRAYVLEFPHLWTHPASYSSTWNRFRDAVQDFPMLTLVILDRVGRYDCGFLGKVLEKVQENIEKVIVLSKVVMQTCDHEKIMQHFTTRELNPFEVFHLLTRETTSSGILFAESPEHLSQELLTEFMQFCDAFPYKTCSVGQNSTALPTDVSYRLPLEESVGIMQIFRRSYVNVYSELRSGLETYDCDRVGFDFVLSTIHRHLTSSRKKDSQNSVRERDRLIKECQREFQLFVTMFENAYGLS